MNNKQMATLIKNLSKEQKTTPTQVFKKTGLSKSFINNLESGSKPSVESIEKLADYFNVSVDYLLGRETEYKAKNITYGNYSTSGDHSTVNNNKTDELPYITLAILEELKSIPEEEQADLFKALKNKKNRLEP